MYVFYILYFIEVIQLKHRNTLKYIFQILDPPHNLKAMYASTLHKPRREPTWHRKCVCVAPTYCFTNLPVPTSQSFTVESLPHERIYLEIMGVIQKSSSNLTETEASRIRRSH